MIIAKKLMDVMSTSDIIDAIKNNLEDTVSLIEAKGRINRQARDYIEVIEYDLNYLKERHG